jgi:dephospho-CoA kinase
MKAIAVSGRIGSGKSSVVRRLSSRHGWGTISFGAFVRSEVVRLGLKPSREELQSVGESLFRTHGPEGILRAAIEATHPDTQVHLIDGIRHVTVWDAVQSTYDESLLIFLDASERERYRRFLTRLDPAEATPSFEAFLVIDRQPIEQGIDGLRDKAGAILDAGAAEEVVTDRADELIRARGFPR